MLRLRIVLAVMLLAVLAAASVPRLPVLVPGPWARQDLATTARQVVATHPYFNSAAPATKPAQSAAGFSSFARSLAAGVRGPISPLRLLEDETLLLNHLGDPHTAVDDNYSPIYSAQLLPLGFYWATGGLVVYPVTGSPLAVRTGDRVVSLGGVPQARLLSRMRRFWSGSSTWLQSLAAEELPLGNTLDWLGLVHHGRVRLVLARPSGQRYAVTVALVPRDVQSLVAYDSGLATFVDRFIAPGGLLEPQGSSFYAWRLTPDYGILWLTACKDTRAYEAAVDAFFSAVRTAGVHYVVIDLQQNPGGNSDVANPLLAHLPIRPRYAQLISYLGITSNPDEIFHGQVYVLINGVTFSSGVDVAEDLTEAAPGVLVGTPSGWASGGPGNVEGFTTPDGIVDYQVSGELMQPLNGKLTPALVPSTPLPLTVREIQRGVDPVARWLSHLATPRVKT